MVKALELAKQYRENPRRTLYDLQEAFRRHRAGEPGGVAPDEFSLRELAEAFVTTREGEPCGREWVREALNPSRGILLLEATAPVNTSAFAVITGQVVQAAVLEAYQRPEFALSRAIRVRNTRKRQEKLPLVTFPHRQSSGLEVPEGQEYPTVGISEDWVETRPVKKRGAVIPLTRELIYQDETGQVLDKAREVGMRVAMEKEEEIADLVVGAIAGCVTEKRAGDASAVTKNLFYLESDNERWTNRLSANPLADWTDIDVVEGELAEVKDPSTGDPIVVAGRVLLVPPHLAMTANRILSATETRSGTDNITVAGNPLASLGIQPLVSPYVYHRLVAAGTPAADAARTWFYGDFERAFVYNQWWPLTVAQQAQGSHTEFYQDVVVAFKASEAGAPSVVEPRVWFRNDPV